MPENIYNRIAASEEYQQNHGWLRLIQIAVFTVSAFATGFINSYAHKERIGEAAAFLLALAIVAFVEAFYFALRQGLTTTYKAGKQRIAAQVCYRAIQITMILNAALLCSMITGFTPPPILHEWNRWSIAVHFALALIGVPAVRDSDAVIQNRILELKAETAKQDIATIRKAAAVGNPLVLICAKVRGVLDALGLAVKLLGNRTTFAADFIRELDALPPPRR